MALDLSGEVLDSVTLSKIDAPLGTYRQSDLTEAQFNEVSLGTWVLCDGRSCSGSAYEALTGKSNVPDLVTEGAFPRQAKAGRNLGTYEGDAIRNITGTYYNGFRDAQEHTGAFRRAGTYGQVVSGYSGGTVYYSNFDASRVVPTAPENRPKNVAVNFFMKIGY